MQQDSFGKIETEIDAAEGQLLAEKGQPFNPAAFLEGSEGYELDRKTDYWAERIRALKSRVQRIKEIIDATKSRLKVNENILESFKEHLVFHLQQNRGLRFRGNTAIFYLGRSESVEYGLKTFTTTISNTINPELLELEPSLSEYCTIVETLVLNTEKVKCDLKKGQQLSWAKLTEKEHLVMK